MSSGPDGSDSGHRARNSELRRSISDMNLSLRRRQGNHVGNDPRGSGNRPNNSEVAPDRKNIVSMINPQPGEVTKTIIYYFKYLIFINLEVFCPKLLIISPQDKCVKPPFIQLSLQVRGSRAEAKVRWTNQPADNEKEDYSSCDLEVMSQSLILPPSDRPYFLLLQGYNQSKARHADR